MILTNNSANNGSNRSQLFIKKQNSTLANSISSASSTSTSTSSSASSSSSLSPTSITTDHNNRPLTNPENPYNNYAQFNRTLPRVQSMPPQNSIEKQSDRHSYFNFITNTTSPATSHPHSSSHLSTSLPSSSSISLAVNSKSTQQAQFNPYDFELDKLLIGKNLDFDISNFDWREGEMNIKTDKNSTSLSSLDKSENSLPLDHFDNESAFFTFPSSSASSTTTNSSNSSYSPTNFPRPSSRSSSGDFALNPDDTYSPSLSSINKKRGRPRKPNTFPLTLSTSSFYSTTFTDSSPNQSEASSPNSTHSFDSFTLKSTSNTFQDLNSLKNNKLQNANDIFTPALSPSPSTSGTTTATTTVDCNDFNSLPFNSFLNNEKLFSKSNSLLDEHEIFSLDLPIDDSIISRSHSHSIELTDQFELTDMM